MKFRGTTILPSLRSEMLFVATAAVCLMVAVVAVTLRYLKPAPPRTIVMAVAKNEGGGRHYAKRYKEILAREGVILEIRETVGSVKSLELLAEASSGVDVTIVPSGTRAAKDVPGIESLGGMNYLPLWIFQRGEPSFDPGQLRGRRIEIGPEGSATRVLALQVLGLTGADQPPTEIFGNDREEATRRLVAGEVDALFVVASAESPAIAKLSGTKGVTLMSIERAEAYARKLPALEHEVLPRGVFDLSADIPASDVDLLATTATLLARADLHPAAEHLLLRAATEVHGSAGVLDHLGEFPSARESGFPLSGEARRYYSSGGSLLLRFLPFWAANLVDRLWVMLLPILALVVPLIRALPPIYRWRVQRRIYRWYASLKEIELDFERAPPKTIEAVEALQSRVDELEVAVNLTATPLAYSANLFVLREHIDLLRRRIQTQASRRPQAQQELNLPT